MVRINLILAKKTTKRYSCPGRPTIRYDLSIAYHVAVVKLEHPVLEEVRPPTVRLHDPS